MQKPPVDFLGIDDDEWERGVSLDRWARERDANAYEVASQNTLFIWQEAPLVIQHLDRKDSPNDCPQHIKAHRRLRDLLLKDLKKRRCVLGVPPQSAVESASPVSLDAQAIVIRNINWGIGPPLSSLGNNPLQGEPVYLRLYRPDRFEGASDQSASGVAPTSAEGEGHALAETPAVLPDDRTQAETAKLRNQLKMWIEKTAQTKNPENYKKDDFLADARKKVDEDITSNMFREVWRSVLVPKGFNKPGRPPGRRQ